jgi:DNA-binding MarR family transcriptional regulator
MAERRPPAFRALLSYQIGGTSDVMRKEAALRLRREHGVSLVQARTLALIEFLQPVRLRDVAVDSGADKAQISRTVSALVADGLVLRRAHAGDARSSHLELTEAGRAKVAGLALSAQAHDRRLRACLQPDEVEQFAGMLARLRACAQDMVDEEERRQGGHA